MKKIYEFLLWDNCSNNCKFCWQRENPRIYDHLKRVEILTEVENFIKSDKFEKGSHILVCGGEVFDKPSDFSALNSFFSNRVQDMLNGVVDLLYINTNLIYTNIKGVYDMLTQLQQAGLISKVRFTTSYDIEGRFKNERDRTLMLTNLKTLKQKFPNLPIVVNTILTKQACGAILSNKFDVGQFMSDYDCWINFIPYIVLDNELTAPRELIFKTLNYVNGKCPGYLERYVPNMCIEQEKWLYMYKNNEFQFCSCKLSDCGHSENFKKYSSGGTCFCCDLQYVFGEYV